MVATRSPVTSARFPAGSFCLSTTGERGAGILAGRFESLTGPRHASAIMLYFRFSSPSFSPWISGGFNAIAPLVPNYR